jgi:hypothetical protein
MSEYVTIEPQPTDDPDVMAVSINQTLTTETAEVYASPAEGDEGSTLAQMVFSGVAGIAALTIYPQQLIIRRDPDTPWEDLLDDLRDALRDFFL